MNETAAQMGDNRPPTPFEAISDKIQELYREAEMWLDGEPISTQGQADDLSNLKNMIREAEKEAEALRKEEVKPFDEGKKAVQDRYNPLIGKTTKIKGKTVLAVEMIGDALKPWLAKLAAEQAERERIAREEAEAKRRAAEEAARKAQAEADSLAAREARERAIAEAEEAEKAAKKVERDKPKTGGGIGRSTHLRTEYHPMLQNLEMALMHYLATRRGDVENFILGLAAADIRAGNHNIPGIETIEDQKVV